MLSTFWSYTGYNRILLGKMDQMTQTNTVHAFYFVFLYVYEYVK